MSAPLHDCVIRFWDNTVTGRKIAGTGFLATGVDGRTYALTCAHVANLALGRTKIEDSPLQGGTVTVDRMGRGGTMSLDLVEWRPPALVHIARSTDLADIAVFTPRAPFTPPYRPPLRIEPPSRVVPPGARVPFDSFGFMGTQNGVSTKGALTTVDAGGWFVADGDDDFQRFIEEGLSGAPVFANGHVLGMVVQRLERDAKQGLVIPAFALARAWPPLASPYPGLPAFDTDTAHLFFGRGRADTPDAEPTGTLKELLDRLNAQQLVALMGASGSGKSSLAKAGVAEIYRQRGWTVLNLRPGREPVRNLAEAIASAVEGLKPSPERLQAMDRWERALEANRLAEALALARGQGAGGVLILIDQFEEFFPGREDRADAAVSAAAATEMARQRAVILPQLRQAVERGEAHCLLTARLDLIEAMVSADENAARLFKDPYPIFVLTRMAAREAREAIEGPAALFGARAEAGFATDLAAAATQGEGRLPLLQETLRQCWAGLRRGADGWRLQPPKELEASDAARLLEDSLARRGDQALAALRPHLADPTGLTDVQRVLLALVRLVADRPVRRLLPLAELPADDRALLGALAKERLVVIDGERNTAELVHEALMVRWPQLATWIEEQRGFLEWRDRFERDFETWRDGGREDKDALRRHDLAQAMDWADGAARERGRPTPDQADFITASQAVHETEDRRKAEELRRTKKWLRMAALALALLAVTLAYAWFEANRAEREALRAEAQTKVAEKQAARAESEARRAEDQAKIADEQANNARRQSAAAQEQAARAEKETAAAQLQESRSLAILAQQESARGDHGTALLLALEALPEPAFGGKRPLSTEAAAALRQAWMRNRETALIEPNCKVHSAFLSPDGRRVVTGTWNGFLRLWDLSGNKPTAPNLEGCYGNRTVASFSRDSRRIVTVSYGEHTAQVWDLSGNTPTAIDLKGHRQPIVAASFSPDGLHIVTASMDQTAIVWDLSGNTPTATVLGGHNNTVEAASFSEDGHHVVTASDRTARVWDLTGGTPVATLLEGHTSDLVAASFSRDGQRVVTASNDGVAIVWDLSKTKPTPTPLKGHTGSLTAASFSPDGQRVITASIDRSARVWSLTGDSPTFILLDGHSGSVTTASFSFDGRHVATASDDGTVRVWDLSRNKPVTTILAGHTGSVRSMSFSQDGRRILTTSFDYTARLWEIPEEKSVAHIWDMSGTNPPPRVNGHNYYLLKAKFSPDGRYIGTVSWENNVRIWDLVSDKPTTTILEGHHDEVNAINFSSDGRRVVTASNDQTARVWSLSEEKPNAIVLEGHKGAVKAASFSSDGRYVVTGSTDNTARVWDLSKDRPTAITLEEPFPVFSASFSPDGRRIIISRGVIGEATASIWDLSENTPKVTILEEQKSPISEIFFSTDGHSVIILSSDGAIRAWDLGSKKIIKQIQTQDGALIDIYNFKLNKFYFTTKRNDDSLHVWEFSNDKPTDILLEGHTSKIEAASFTQGGRKIITASADGTVRRWDVYPDINELVTLVRSRLTRCLSTVQREQFGLRVTDNDRPRDLIPAPDASGLCPR